MSTRNQVTLSRGAEVRGEQLKMGVGQDVAASSDAGRLMALGHQAATNEWFAALGRAFHFRATHGGGEVGTDDVANFGDYFKL